MTGAISRWRDCDSADTPLLIPIETPNKGTGGCHQMTVSGRRLYLYRRGVDVEDIKKRNSEKAARVLKVLAEGGPPLRLPLAGGKPKL